MYYYTYYGKYVTSVAPYKVRKLRELTSVPLEIGNVVHDVLEAFLKRLQKDDSDIDESRFFDYAKAQTKEYFSRKTFLELYYRQVDSLDIEKAHARIRTCLENFIASPVYNWIVMKAIRNKENWLIEPEGYGETRLAGQKAYCKMDFLFPVDGHIYILDWKTGRRDEYKHASQLVGYASAASANFNIPVDIIFPKIVYLYPQFEEMELSFAQKDFTAFFDRIKEQTAAMLSVCADTENNMPLPIDSFPMSPSDSLCPYCNYQELCFPEGFDRAKGGFGQDCAATPSLAS
jgi:CRISPR/Cas system-associated exonuclease Cas4 (RecB family)